MVSRALDIGGASLVVFTELETQALRSYGRLAQAPFRSSGKRHKPPGTCQHGRLKRPSAGVKVPNWLLRLESRRPRLHVFSSVFGICLIVLNAASAK
jgi:hypothetical protein